MNLAREVRIRLSQTVFWFALISISGCGLVKAIDYSFYVAEHTEFEFEGKCYGIENEPLERLLITDCGGYLNVVVSTLTIGLAQSGVKTTRRYMSAAETYLQSKYSVCTVTNHRDHGGRIFEIFYACQMPLEP